MHTFFLHFFQRGAFVSEPAILVKRKARNSQIWAMEKFENKIIDMRDLYEERKEKGLPMKVDDDEDDLPLVISSDGMVCVVYCMASFLFSFCSILIIGNLNLMRFRCLSSKRCQAMLWCHNSFVLIMPVVDVHNGYDRALWLHNIVILLETNKRRKSYDI